MDSDSPYAELVARLQKAHTLATVGELLGWDEQVNLPSGAADQRAAQQAAVAEVQHAAATVPRIGQLLAGLEAAELTDPQRAVVRHARREFDRTTKLPTEFVREKAMQGSRGYHAWTKAKAADDFASFAPVLEKNLELARREAAYLGWGDRAYDYMIDVHDAGMTAAIVGDLFAGLKRELVPLVREVTHLPGAEKARAAARRLRGFPIEQQRRFLRIVTSRIGFDYECGRIDVSLHPFCAGTGADVRLTTRFDENNPLDSLFSAVHEAGHGLYEQGLPREHLGTALGIAAGMAMHESQSRIWENQVARSRGFWRYFEPEWRRLFSRETEGFSSDDLHLAVNAIEPTLIRVDADEVTYNLHILLRFEIERRLFAGELAVADLPKAWRELSRDLIGLEPSGHRDGVLQDVHWSDGAFGYFPSYCIGNMIAAQLWYRALEQRPRLESDFATGDFTWLLGWLRENVHRHGRRYSTLELVRRATGEELTPDYLVRYLKERYLAPMQNVK